MLKSFFTLFLLLFVFLSSAGQEIGYTVLFDFNKYDIPDTSLVRLVKLIHTNQIERILIEGHCDSVGSKAYNYLLSTQRANEVKRLFTDNNVLAQNIKTCIGYGKDKPMTDNETEEDRQINRRAHITIFLKDTITQLSTVDIDTLSVSRFDIKDMAVGKNIILNNIYFWGGRHVIKPESYPELKQLYRLLMKYDQLEIEIEGHVCCTTYQPDGYDWDTETENLSLNRARAIYNFLIENGINKSRLGYKGYGGTRKVNLDESTEELRSLNRRVELKVLKL